MNAPANFPAARTAARQRRAANLYYCSPVGTRRAYNRKSRRHHCRWSKCFLHGDAPQLGNAAIQPTNFIKIESEPIFHADSQSAHLDGDRAPAALEQERPRQSAAIPDPEWPIDDLAAAKNTKLASLIERGITTMTYTYDMGDDWRHTVTIQAVETGDAKVNYPRFVAGQRRYPPEDVGGLPGFENFLDVIADPAHPEHREVLRWYGRPYSPDDMAELAAKRRIGVIARRRLAAKKAAAKMEIYSRGDWLTLTTFAAELC